MTRSYRPTDTYEYDVGVVSVIAEMMFLLSYLPDCSVGCLVGNEPTDVHDLSLCYAQLSHSRTAHTVLSLLFRSLLATSS